MAWTSSIFRIYNEHLLARKLILVKSDHPHPDIIIRGPSQCMVIVVRQDDRRGNEQGTWHLKQTLPGGPIALLLSTIRHSHKKE